MNTCKIAFYNRPVPSVDSYYKMIDAAVEYGLSAIEGFSHMELTEPDIEAAKHIREYAEKSGISFCCFSVFSDIVQEDATEQIKRLKRFADVAAILGSPFLHHTVITSNDPQILQEPTYQQLFDRGIAGIREIYDYAATKGVRAVYEDQAFILNGGDGIARLLDAVNRDIGLVADFGNIHQADESIIPFMQRFADRIVHVHLKDMQPAKADSPYPLLTKRGNWIAEVEIGQGVVDFQQAISLLQTFGYDGYYALEYGASQDDSPTIAEALQNIRSWFTNKE